MLGWGKTSDADRKTSNVLMEVKLEVVDEATCRAAMVNATITKSTLCAGGVKGHDSCYVSMKLLLIKHDLRQGSLLDVEDISEYLLSPPFRSLKPPILMP